MGQNILKFIYLLFIFSLITLSLQAAAVTGDTNGDNLATIVDALRIAQYAVSLIVPGFDAGKADVTGDDKINIVDALAVAQYYVGLITVFPVDTNAQLGDVNGDKKINIIDALQVSQYYIGLPVPGFNTAKADVDGNTVIDIIDALIICRYSIKIISAFPAETGQPSLLPTIAPPVNLDTVNTFLGLTDSEKNQLLKNGFAVLTSTGLSNTLTAGYSQLINHWDVPAFITSDALLHVFHITFADMLIRAEELYLYDRLLALTGALNTAVALEYQQIAAETELKTAAGQLWLFTAVAKELINGSQIYTGAATDPVAGSADDLLDYIYAATRVPTNPGDEDYTQYKVKSHYTASDKLCWYYRAMKWLQRKRFLIINENSPAEADNALLNAAILARLIAVNPAILSGWEWLYTFYTAIADPVSGFTPLMINQTMHDLFGSMYDTEGYSLLSDKNNRALLRNALETGDFVTEKIVQFMGEPYLMDEDAFRSVLAPEIITRNLPKGFDMAAIVLDSAPAYEFLAAEEDDYPGFNLLLGKKALHFSELTKQKWTSSIYNYWYYTLRGLSPAVFGTAPSWMQTSGWQKEKLNTQLSSWVELHNDYVNLEIAGFTPTPTPVITKTPTYTATPASGNGTISLVPSSITVSRGAGFVTNAYVNTGTQKVAAYGIRIAYPDSLVAVNTSVGTSGVEAGANGFVAAVNPENPGSLVISGFDATGRGPGSNLHLLKVNWIAGNTTGSGNLKLTVDSLTDENYSTIGTPQGSSADITVSAGTITPTLSPTSTPTGIPTRTGTIGPTNTPSRTPTPTPVPTPTHMPGFVEPYPEFYSRLSGMCDKVITLSKLLEPNLVHTKRFGDIRDWADRFGAYALKIHKNTILTEAENMKIKLWGAELATYFNSGGMTPEGAAKRQVIADFFSYNDQVLHIATGKLHPVLILYHVPDATTSFAAVGYVVSYYEIVKNNNYRINDEEWIYMLEKNAIELSNEVVQMRNNVWVDK